MIARDDMAGLSKHQEELAGKFLNEKPDPEIDCQGEGGDDCQCERCLNDCCPNCKVLLESLTVGDEYFRRCPECDYVEY